AFEPQLAVAAHGLDEQLLLGAEVVVQQPARDARLARDVVERGPGRAAPRDARAHRVDDALRLAAGERALAVAVTRRAGATVVGALLGYGCIGRVHVAYPSSAGLRRRPRPREPVSAGSSWTG